MAMTLRCRIPSCTNIVVILRRSRYGCVPQLLLILLLHKLISLRSHLIVSYHEHNLNNDIQFTYLLTAIEQEWIRYTHTHTLAIGLSGNECSESWRQSSCFIKAAQAPYALLFWMPHFLLQMCGSSLYRKRCKQSHTNTADYLNEYLASRIRYKQQTWWAPATAVCLCVCLTDKIYISYLMQRWRRR